MWETKSVNSILVNGQGQKPLRSQEAKGKIVSFHSSKAYDYVAGEASKAYPGVLKRFTRSILFIKPEVIIMFDQLEALEPSTFQLLLHSPEEMKINSQHDITLENGAAECKVAILTPDDLEITQTDKFDPPPRPRVKLKQWHLQAGSTEKQEQCQFVTVMRPYRKGEAVPTGVEIKKLSAGYACRIELADGEAIVLLRTVAGQSLAGYEAETDGDVAVIRFSAAGKVADSFVTGGSTVTYQNEKVN